MEGWISLHRKIVDHWIYSNTKMSNLEAWLHILLTVNHANTKCNIKNTLYYVKRGQSLKSLDTWGKEFGWDKSKVRRFFKLLESDNMIVTKSEQKTTRLTVCNYDSYQGKRNADETQMKRKRNADETQVTPNNNDNNGNNDFNEKNEIKTKSDLVENEFSPSFSLDSKIPLKEKNESLSPPPKKPKTKRVTRNDWVEDLIYPFDDLEFMNTWELWIKYRYEIKKPYKGKISEQSALKQLSELFETSDDAIKAINRSISNTWQGIFKEKKKTRSISCFVRVAKAEKRTTKLKL